MQIPPEKKSTFYVISALVMLAGIILGALLVSYIFFRIKDKMCLLSQPAKVNTELTSAQVQKATSLQQNANIFGKVITKEAGAFTLEFSMVNPLDTKNSTTTTAKIPFDPTKDEVIKITQVPPTPTTSSIKQTNASFSDIKVGQQVWVKILNGKKTVYLSYIPSS